MRTLAEINAKIRDRRAVVWTVEAVKEQVAASSVAAVAQQVDVVTTGTF